MKIAVVTKRHYTGRDLVNDRFGRVFEFIRGLAARGHHVLVLCLEYGSPTRTEVPAVATTGPIEWHIRATGAFLAVGLAAYIREALEKASAFRPDLILSASDAFNTWLGAHLAQALLVPQVADLYDNFEAFGATRLPGMRFAFRRSLRRSAGIVAVTGVLADLVVRLIRPTGRIEVIGNGIDPAKFHPGDRRAARKSFGLDTGRVLVGTAGALDDTRGIGDLFAAVHLLRAAGWMGELVVAGRLRRAVPTSERPCVRYLGDLPHERVPDLFQALDLGVVCNRDSSFGRCCQPQKVVEMLGCNLPVVMADVGVAREIMGQCTQALYRPGNPEDLARAIAWQLEASCRPHVGDLSWEARIAKLDAFINQIAAR